jgi:hypothetical protein
MKMDKSIAPVAEFQISENSSVQVPAMTELAELQLALVGGGIGDIIVA